MNFKLASLALIATILASTSAAPAPAQPSVPASVTNCGPATAARKAALLSMKAAPEDLAITIQETSCEMSSAYSSIHLGDVDVNGKNKTGDAANFGLFKNNWYALRTWCSEFKGQSPGEYLNGAVLDNNDGKALACLQDLKKQPNFFEVQRNGETPGSCTPDPQGTEYQTAIGEIVTYLNTGSHMTDGSVLDPHVQAC